MDEKTAISSVRWVGWAIILLYVITTIDGMRRDLYGLSQFGTLTLIVLFPFLISGILLLLHRGRIFTVVIFSLLTPFCLYYTTLGIAFFLEAGIYFYHPSYPTGRLLKTNDLMLVFTYICWLVIAILCIYLFGFNKDVKALFAKPAATAEVKSSEVKS